MGNENCLEGFKCPACGHEDDFKLACQVWLRVTDDGTDTDDLGDVEWDDTALCECLGCGKVARVGLFRFACGVESAEADIVSLLLDKCGRPNCGAYPRLRRFDDGQLVIECTECAECTMPHAALLDVILGWNRLQRGLDPYVKEEQIE